MLYNTTKWDHIKQIQSFQTLFFKFLKTNCTPKRRLHTKENNTHSKVLVKQILGWPIRFQERPVPPQPPLVDTPLHRSPSLCENSIVCLHTTNSLCLFPTRSFFFFKLYLHKTCYVTALCITGWQWHIQHKESLRLWTTTHIASKLMSCYKDTYLVLAPWFAAWVTKQTPVMRNSNSANLSCKPQLAELKLTCTLKYCQVRCCALQTDLCTGVW